MEYKGILQSKTVWGLIILLIGLAKKQFGWDFTDSQAEQWLDLGLQAVGAALNLYGRWKATKPLGLPPKGSITN